MPNIKSAKKRAQIQERNRLRNNAFKSSIRTARKKVYDGLSKGMPAAELEPLVNQAFSLIDRAILKGILHKNTGARVKSRIAARVSKGQKGAA